MKKKYKKRKRYKRIVEIKTNKCGWKKVELLSVNKGGTITFKDKDGNIVKRKMKRIRMGIVKKVPQKIEGFRTNKWFKKFKTKRKRRRVKKRGRGSGVRWRKGAGRKDGYKVQSRTKVHSVDFVLGEDIRV